jgi:hypothetical protein
MITDALNHNKLTAIIYKNGNVIFDFDHKRTAGSYRKYRIQVFYDIPPAAAMRKIREGKN